MRITRVAGPQTLSFSSLNLVPLNHPSRRHPSQEAGFRRTPWPWTWRDVRCVLVHSLGELQAEGVVCQLDYFKTAPFRPLVRCQPNYWPYRTPAGPLVCRVGCLLWLAVSLHCQRLPTSDTNSIRVYAPPDLGEAWAIGPFAVAVAVGTGQGQLTLSL